MAAPTGAAARRVTTLRLYVTSLHQSRAGPGSTPRIGAQAAVAKLVKAMDSKSIARKSLWVRLPPAALRHAQFGGSSACHAPRRRGAEQLPDRSADRPPAHDGAGLG